MEWTSVRYPFYSDGMIDKCDPSTVIDDVPCAALLSVFTWKTSTTTTFAVQLSHRHTIEVGAGENERRHR